MLFLAGIATVSLKYEPSNVLPSIQKTEASALDRYIERLVGYECAGCPENYRRIDSNGEYSYSCLQFQWQTFKANVRKYHLADQAETGELMNLIYDCDFQKTVAKKMFENEPKAYFHWINSVNRGLGLPPKDESHKLSRQ